MPTLVKNGNSGLKLQCFGHVVSWSSMASTHRIGGIMGTKTRPFFHAFCSQNGLGKNVVEKEVLQDRNRDTFHRKTASSSSTQNVAGAYVSSKRPLRVLWKKHCRGRRNRDTFHRKNGFKFYTKIVAEAFVSLKNDLFCGRNVAEEGVLQDRNRDTFHRKTASSS